MAAWQHEFVNRPIYTAVRSLMELVKRTNMGMH